MKIIKNLKSTRHLIIFIASCALQIQYSFAAESKMDLLMKGIYEHDKKADFSDDPEGAKQAEKFKKDYEAMLKAKKQLEDKRMEIKIIEELGKIWKERGDRNIYHEVEIAVAKQYKVSREDAHKMIENYDPRVNKVLKSMRQVQVNQDKKEAKRRIEERGKNIKNER